MNTRERAQARRMALLDYLRNHPRPDTIKALAQAVGQRYDRTWWDLHWLHNRGYIRFALGSNSRIDCQTIEVIRKG